MSTNQNVTGLRSSHDNWFTCVDTVVLEDKELSPTAKLIFSVLCAIAGFGYRTCALSDDKAADIAGVSECTIRMLYSELEARGIIFREGNVIHLIGCDAPCYNEVC